MLRPRGSTGTRPQARVERKRLLVAGSFYLAAWVSCSVYDESLLTGPRSDGTIVPEGGDAGETNATGGTDVLGGRGGSAGTGAAGGTASGGAGTTSGGSSGTAGKGGTAGSGAGAGGSTGGSSGKGGTGGSSGSGGAGGNGGTSGTAGSTAAEGGAPDCETLGDCCPDDDTKTEPGACGCGTPDTDTDADDTPDCNDQCPEDDTRVAPGACGCGVLADDADCAALKDALVHRYSFGGTGTTVTDSKGDLDGTVLGTGAMLSGTGTLVLSGGVDPANDSKKQYVNLGTGCLDGLVDATFEAWLTWSTTCSGSGCTNALDWQRVFDFGQTSTTTTGSYVFLTPRAGGQSTNPTFAAASTTGANNEVATGFRVSNAKALTAGAHHFALVVDDAGNQVRLYLDGVEIGTGAYATTASLASITAAACYLGRSNYASDPYLNGTFDEFRIYDEALPASLITFSFDQGPNAPFL